MDDEQGQQLVAEFREYVAARCVLLIAERTGIRVHYTPNFPSELELAALSFTMDVSDEILEMLDSFAQAQASKIIDTVLRSLAARDDHDHDEPWRAQ